MTPAINIVKKAKLAYTVHEYDHDPAAEAFGPEAAAKLGFPESRVFKTLVVNLDDKELAVGILPVSAMLSMKLIAKAHGAKKAKMGDKTVVERTTGYIMGGVSPLAQKKRLKTVIDRSAQDHETILISAGRRGLQIELKPADLANLLNARLADICQ